MKSLLNARLITPKSAHLSSLCGKRAFISLLTAFSLLTPPFNSAAIAIDPIEKPDGLELTQEIPDEKSKNESLRLIAVGLAETGQVDRAITVARYTYRWPRDEVLNRDRRHFS